MSCHGISGLVEHAPIRPDGSSPAHVRISGPCLLGPVPSYSVIMACIGCIVVLSWFYPVVLANWLFFNVLPNALIYMGKCLFSSFRFRSYEAYTRSKDLFNPFPNLILNTGPMVEYGK